ncbi:hypothetical protein [Undibacterium sp.]|uniref:hypothetical protein n=1 Tax=Undibacterium sp. TaxID=1914977 RepID=UPI00273123BD|nr:hypothetical protein [Undibacterium sp.]MDP1978057.1 hypothetical protein [Undibacterium sp.]
MKKLFILFFCLWFLNCSIQQARAQAAPISIVQNALGGSFRNFLVKRGFAANDPRFGATFSGVSGTLASWATGAVALAAGALSAPAWLTLAVGVLGIPLAIAAGENAAKWLWDKNNPKKVKVNYPARPDETPAFAVGDANWAVYAGGKVYARGSDPKSTGAQFATMLGQGWQLRDPCSRSSSSMWQCTAYKWDAQKEQWVDQSSYSVWYESSSPVACPANHYADVTGACFPNALVQPANNNVPQDIQAAVNSIPGFDMGKAVNPEVMASTLNKAWQETAAQPGYTGLPYDYTNPITAADIASWGAQNPDIYPKVEDWVKPQDPVNKPWTLPNTTAPVTSYDPGANTNTGTNPAGASQAQVNLGPDPGIPAPQMEETPTAQAILKPIFDLLPDLKNFKAPPIGGECPKPSFEAFETTFRLEKHCDLAEQNRNAIRAGMMVVFSLASLLIVLRA